MGPFGRKNREAQAQRERDEADRARARADLARELDEERDAGLQAAAVQPGRGGGITHSGPEAVNISGQAVGGSGGAPREPRRPRVADRQADSGGGSSGPLVQNTGRGQINIADSVIGGHHVTEYQAGPGDSPKAPEADREAG